MIPTPQPTEDRHEAVAELLDCAAGILGTAARLSRQAHPAGDVDPPGKIAATGTEHLMLSGDPATVELVKQLLEPPDGQVWVELDLDDSTVRWLDDLVVSEPVRYPSAAAAIRTALEAAVACDEARRAARDTRPTAPAEDDAAIDPAPAGSAATTEGDTGDR